MYKLIGADDILAKGVSNLAQLRPVLGTNGDPLAANATLRKDEWETIDARVNEVLGHLHPPLRLITTQALICAYNMNKTRV